MGLPPVSTNCLKRQSLFRFHHCAQGSGEGAGGGRGARCIVRVAWGESARACACAHASGAAASAHLVVNGQLPCCDFAAAQPAKGGAAARAHNAVAASRALHKRAAGGLGALPAVQGNLCQRRSILWALALARSVRCAGRAPGRVRCIVQEAKPHAADAARELWRGLAAPPHLALAARAGAEAHAGLAPLQPPPRQAAHHLRTLLPIQQRGKIRVQQRQPAARLIARHGRVARAEPRHNVLPQAGAVQRMAARGQRVGVTGQEL